MRTSRAWFQRFGPLLIGAIGLSPASCGKDAGEGSVHPVSGQVIFEGGRPPPEGAIVVFNPVKDPQRFDKGYPRGFVGKDGKFKLSTYKADDGAPAGEYRVTITWRKKKPGAEEEEEDDGPDLLGGRYADASKSGLTATVKEGTNELKPFVLR